MPSASSAFAIAESKSKSPRSSSVGWSFSRKSFPLVTRKGFNRSLTWSSGAAALSGLAFGGFACLGAAAVALVSAAFDLPDMTRASSAVPGGHELLLLAEALDADPHDVAGLRNRGGFMPRPTPGGVPVVITSPGSSSMNCDM